jgi:hypothetical protein
MTGPGRTPTIAIERLRRLAADRRTAGVLHINAKRALSWRSEMAASQPASVSTSLNLAQEALPFTGDATIRLKKIVAPSIPTSRHFWLSEAFEDCCFCKPIHDASSGVYELQGEFCQICKKSLPHCQSC